MIKVITYILSLSLLLPSLSYAWRLVWDASTGTVDGYYVEISDDKEATYKFSYITAGDVTELLLDDKCQFDKLYSFRVSAFNAAGISLPCPSISWKRPAFIPPATNPLPPVNLPGAPAPPNGGQVE